MVSINTIQKLWDTFGGTVNEAGYKVLDPHIGLIYGDGCTLNKVWNLWNSGSAGLLPMWFSVLVLSASTLCSLPDNKFTVLTRDTWGMAMKATYGVFGGKKFLSSRTPRLIMVWRSLRRVAAVYGITRRKIFIPCTDGYSEWVEDDNTQLIPVYKDGESINEQEFLNIRARLYGG